MKRSAIILFLIFFSLLLSPVFGQETTDDDLYGDIGETELSQRPGLTPDSPLYFIDEFVEGILVGNNPEKALKYKEEKIIEAQQMIRAGKKEEAKKAFEKAEKYGVILEQEVSPEIEIKVRASSKAVKAIMEDLHDDMDGEGWDEIKDIVEHRKEQ